MCNPYGIVYNLPYPLTTEWSNIYSQKQKEKFDTSGVAREPNLFTTSPQRRGVQSKSPTEFDVIHSTSIDRGELVIADLLPLVKGDLEADCASLLKLPLMRTNSLNLTQKNTFRYFWDIEQ